MGMSASLINNCLVQFMQGKNKASFSFLHIAKLQKFLYVYEMGCHEKYFVIENVREFRTITGTEGNNWNF